MILLIIKQLPNFINGFIKQLPGRLRLVSFTLSGRLPTFPVHGSRYPARKTIWSSEFSLLGYMQTMSFARF